MKNETRIVEKDTNLMKLINEFPETIPILMGYGLHCVTCHFSQFDTLENGAKIHGLSNEDFEMMLRDLNTLILENLKEKGL